VQLIGVDAGGTFTDTVVATGAGELAVGKALSTPGAFEEGIIASLEDAAGRLGIGLDQLLAETDLLAHGTTVGLNALLTGTGAPVGLLTTAGFESTLAIAKANKIVGLSETDLERPTRWDKPPLLVPRRLTRGVDERIDARGEILRDLDEEQAAACIAELGDAGVGSIAVALLWSVANPAHEQRLAELVRRILPDVHLSVSSELVARIGEYERTSTVVVDAYVGPLVSSYLQDLDAELRRRGFRGLLVLMRMGGGVMPVELARQMPVHTLHSGPVGGVAGAARIGAQLGHHHIITTDVGGTSFDVGLVIDGDVLYSSRPMIERQALAIPVVDVTSIGTGGGSIAWIDDALGTLRVGPASAGARPGPACYGRGGLEPTVTDAAVVLGYLDRLGRELELDAAAAARAVRTRVAEPLGLDLHAAADGIVQVACEQMRDLIRRTTVQRGHDPADFTLYAFGGAGPQYAGRYAADLGVPEVVIPLLAAELSAFGAVASDVRVSVEQDIAPGDLHASLARLREVLDRVEAQARAQLAGGADDPGGGLLGGTGAHAVVGRTIGLRFYRQIHRIDVPVPPGPLDEATADALLATFTGRYERIVGEGTARAGTPIEVVSVGVQVAIGVPLVVPASRAEHAGAPVRWRRAWFAGTPARCAVYDWEDLGAGQCIVGPAFVESTQTTVVVHPGQRASTDGVGNLRIAWS